MNIKAGINEADQQPSGLLVIPWMIVAYCFNRKSGSK